MLSEGTTLRRRTLISCRVPRGQAAAWARGPAVLVPGLGIGLVPPVAGSALLVDADGAPERADGGLLPGFGPDWIAATEYRHTLSFAAPGGPGPGPVELGAGGAPLPTRSAIPRCCPRRSSRVSWWIGSPGMPGTPGSPFPFLFPLPFPLPFPFPFFADSSRIRPSPGGAGVPAYGRTAGW